MLQGFLIYLGVALGTSALVLALRIVAMLRPPRTGREPTETPRRELDPAPRTPRRQVASGWPGGPEGAARLR